MRRFGAILWGTIGLLAGPVSVHAAVYWFSADPAAANVYDGTQSSSVDVYLNSDTPFYGVYDSYTELNVQAGGNATLNSVNYSFDYGASTVSPTFGEITDAGLVDGPTSATTSVLLGTFTVDMLAGGTPTTVTLDADPTSPSLIYISNSPDSFAAVTVTSGQAVFTPLVPEPAAAMLVAGAALLIKRRRRPGITKSKSGPAHRWQQA